VKLWPCHHSMERPSTAPASSSGSEDVWAALTHIFADIDVHGGVGDEAEELGETLDVLRGLLDVHTQLGYKKVALTAKQVEAARERDAALERLAELGVVLPLGKVTNNTQNSTEKHST